MYANLLYRCYAPRMGLAMVEIRDAKWVCQRHALSPWPHGDCKYPGMPCPKCNHTKGRERPELPPGSVSYVKVEDDDWV